MRNLFLVLFTLLSFQAKAFDGMTSFVCDQASIQIFDNTSNGIPVEKAVFAIVHLKSSSYVISASNARPGEKFTFAVGSNRSASFVDKVNELVYSNCLETAFLPLLKSKP
jgi:hypothetical protein